MSTQEQLNALHAATVRLVERTPELRDATDAEWHASAGAATNVPNPTYTQRKEALAVITGADGHEADIPDGWSTPEGRDAALLGVLGVFADRLGLDVDLFGDGGYWVFDSDEPGMMKPVETVTEVITTLTQAVEAL